MQIQIYVYVYIEIYLGYHISGDTIDVQPRAAFGSPFPSIPPLFLCCRFFFKTTSLKATPWYSARFPSGTSDSQSFRMSPQIRMWEVLCTVAAPPSIVVKCGGWFFVWSFVVLCVSCVVWWCSCRVFVCVCVLFLFLQTNTQQPMILFARSCLLACTRYCHYQYCMVYGMCREDRGGGYIWRNSRAIVLQ